MRFSAAAPQIPAARRWVVRRAEAAGADPDVVRVVALLTTEAVTNAVMHGPPGGTVEVQASVVGGGVFRVEVTDGSTARPVLRDVPTHALSGRGVMLIDRLSAAWGVDARDDSKTVWFDVAI